MAARPDRAANRGPRLRGALTAFHVEVPPRVEYALTPLGETLIEPSHMLTEWAREHGEAVLDALEAAADSAPADH